MLIDVYAKVLTDNQIEGQIITLRDGRDQVKFPPTCGKPTTFRAKCERPLQSVMNFGSAAGADSDECPVSGGQTSEVDLLTGQMLRQLMVDFVL